MRLQNLSNEVYTLRGKLSLPDIVCPIVKAGKSFSKIFLIAISSWGFLVENFVTTAQDSIPFS